jgi:uncharacterized membrane protein YdfJ with MMPL/SSD domain
MFEALGGFVHWFRWVVIAAIVGVAGLTFFPSPR